MPARQPHHSFTSRKTWLLMTSISFWVSPCTLMAPPTSPWPAASAPQATLRAIDLQASATFRIRLLKSPLACGKRRRSSIRNWVRVRRCGVVMAVS